MATKLYRLGNVRLSSPLVGASGLFSFGYDIPEQFLDGFGAIVLKTVTLEPSHGNPSPRIAEVPSGIVNSIGLENPGWKDFQRKILPAVAEHMKKEPYFIVSVASRVPEAEVMVSEMENFFPFLEINLSCPNVGTELLAEDIEVSAKVISIWRRALDSSFIIAKLPPFVSSRLFFSVVEALLDAGADAISFSNTLPVVPVSLQTGEPLLGNVFGGYSGTVLFYLTLRNLKLIKERYPDLFVIAGGGVMSASQVKLLLREGASLVFIGSAFARNPYIAKEIMEELGEA